MARGCSVSFEKTNDLPGGYNVSRMVRRVLFFTFVTNPIDHFQANVTLLARKWFNFSIRYIGKHHLQHLSTSFFHLNFSSFTGDSIPGRIERRYPKPVNITLLQVFQMYRKVLRRCIHTCPFSGAGRTKCNLVTCNWLLHNCPEHSQSSCTCKVCFYNGGRLVGDCKKLKTIEKWFTLLHMFLSVQMWLMAATIILVIWSRLFSLSTYLKLFLHNVRLYRTSTRSPSIPPKGELSHLSSSRSEWRQSCQCNGPKLPILECSTWSCDKFGDKRTYD